jgi:hypothetical protein
VVRGHETRQRPLPALGEATVMASNDDPAPPRAWAEAFRESEAEVRSVLDDVREAHLLGDHETVREQLRAFARAEGGIFRLVALAVLDVEALYDDLSSQYEEEAAPTADLRALADEYGRLADELELVFAERTRDLRNPMPTLRCGFRYSESLDLPRLDYDVYSGDVELCGFVHPPSQALMLARTLVVSVRELLERVESNDDAVADTERERLARAYEGATRELDRLEAFVDADDAAEDADAYDDWSFY